MKSVSSLVWLLLALAVLILVLGIGTIYNLNAQALADDSCSSSVILRAGLQRGGWDGGDITCQTEVKTFDGDEDDVRKQLIGAHNRCKRQFATALQNDIIAGENTFCHVCGIYDAQEITAVSGLGDVLEPIRVGGRELRGADSEHIEVGNQQFLDEIELPLAIIFIQDRTEELSLLTLLGTQQATTTTVGAVVAGGITIALAGTGVGAILLAVGAAGAGGVGGYITGHVLEGPESSTYSGIVIRPYQQGVFEALNCQELRT